MEEMKASRKTPPPPLLTDMRWVFDNPEKKGESESVRNCRAMLKNPRVFMERMAQMESAWLAAEKAEREREAARLNMEARAKSPSEEKEEEQEDMGRERVLEVLAEEWERVEAAARHRGQQVVSGLAGGGRGPEQAEPQGTP